MKKDPWDQEMAMVLADLQRLTKSGYLLDYAQNRHLASQHQKLVKLNMDIDQHLDYLGRVLERPLTLGPREKAMVHWGRLYVEKARHFHQMRQKIFGKTLWIKLIRARLFGLELSPKENQRDVDSEDLVALALKQNQLRKMEADLKTRLKKLDQVKQSLKNDYEHLAIRQANFLASRAYSSPRQGRTFESPSPGGLALIGKALRREAAILSSTIDRQEMRHSLHEFATKTEWLLGHCGGLATAGTSGTTPPGDTLAPHEFRKAVVELTHLEAKVEGLLAKDRALEIPPMRPILVRNPPKTDKTMTIKKSHQERSNMAITSGSL